LAAAIGRVERGRHVIVYRVSCHCGRIQLDVDAELGEVFACNCSICTRSGFLHWYVEPERVTLLTEKQAVTTYVYRGIDGGQHFCPTCGDAVYRTSVQWPPPLSVNARCIEGIDLDTLDIRPYDGRSLP
jgi:hypothetical protein